MKKNYSQLIRNVQARQNPDAIILEKAIRDELGSISYSDVLVFIRTAMLAVDSDYTRKSMEAGEKVKEHLQTVLTDVVYKYQGSVMTNTHIKGHSDIDLLTICDKFYSWDGPRVRKIVEDYESRQKFHEASIKKLETEVNLSSYGGDSLEDLRQIRYKSETKLRDTYFDCDTSKPKAIRITNQNLHRDVDIVTANWYDDVTSIINDKGDYRGVQVYDKVKNEKGLATYPFLSIARINSRSAETSGRLKRMIRFLKHCKAEASVDIDLNSFDINAICYDIDPHNYSLLRFYELVPLLYRQLKSLCENDTHANSLVSVDGHEWIFRYDPGKRQNLQYLLNEVEKIYLDLNQSNLLAS